MPARPGSTSIVAVERIVSRLASDLVDDVGDGRVTARKRVGVLGVVAQLIAQAAELANGDPAGFAGLKSVQASLPSVSRSPAAPQPRANMMTAVATRARSGTLPFMARNITRAIRSSALDPSNADVSQALTAEGRTFVPTLGPRQMHQAWKGPPKRPRRRLVGKSCTRRRSRYVIRSYRARHADVPGDRRDGVLRWRLVRQEGRGSGDRGRDAEAVGSASAGDRCGHSGGRGRVLARPGRRPSGPGGRRPAGGGFGSGRGGRRQIPAGG